MLFRHKKLSEKIRITFRFVPVGFSCVCALLPWVRAALDRSGARVAVRHGVHAEGVQVGAGRRLSLHGHSVPVSARPNRCTRGRCYRLSFLRFPLFALNLCSLHSHQLSKIIPSQHLSRTPLVCRTQPRSSPTFLNLAPALGFPPTAPRSCPTQVGAPLDDRRHVSRVSRHARDERRNTWRRRNRRWDDDDRVAESSGPPPKGPSSRASRWLFFVLVFVGVSFSANYLP